MTYEIIVGLLTNIVLLMSLSVIYSLFSNDTKFSRLGSKIVMGISVSVVGFVIMFSSVEVEPGIFFDGRSILMLLSGLFYGIVPVIIGGVALSSFRVFMGGSGVIPGILWVLIPGLVGILWRYWRIKRNTSGIDKVKLLEQYLFLFITQLSMVALLLLFPNRVSREAINAVLLPLVLFYPIGGLLVSMFMLRQRTTYFNAQAIRTREKEYNNLFNKSAAYSFLINPETGKFMNVNQAAIERYGYTLEEFKELSVADINMLEGDALAKLQDNSKGERQRYYRVKHVLKNREIIDVEVRSVDLMMDGSTYDYATVTDISRSLKNQEKYQDVNVKLETTLQSVSEGIISANEFGEIEIINEVARKYLSVDEKAIGRKLTDIFEVTSRDNSKVFKEIYNSLVSNNKSYKADKPYLLVNNVSNLTLYIDFSLSPIYFEETFKGSILVFRDVTNQFEQNEQIQYISQHDYLTGLYNRYFLEVEMKRLDTPRQLPITVIHGDVNGLKLTNDAFGHTEGDKLLEEISDILKKSTRSEDIISRWGGDEFIILLPQTSHENALKVITRIRDLQAKSRYENMTPSISLGIATKTDENQDLNAILIDAETKMYNNKQKDGKVMRTELLKKFESILNNIHPDFGPHCKNVQKYAIEFGEFLDLPKKDIGVLSSLGYYHDIGWINLPRKILDKSNKLNEDESILVQSHVEVGFRIMKSIPELSNTADLILSHHERWDGDGYPSGLKGNSIPYLTRIISICDAFDMMINNKVYTPIKSHEKALEEIMNNKGTQFDPDLADKFIEYQTNKKNDV